MQNKSHKLLSLVVVLFKINKTKSNKMHYEVKFIGTKTRITNLNIEKRVVEIGIVKKLLPLQHLTTHNEISSHTKVFTYFIY